MKDCDEKQEFMQMSPEEVGQRIYKIYTNSTHAKDVDETAFEAVVRRHLKAEGVLREFREIQIIETQVDKGVPQEVKVIYPPSYTFKNIGRFLLTKKAYERILEESIAMMEEEYIEACNKKQFGFARWIKIRYWFVFLMVLGLNLPVIKQLLDIKDKIAK